MKERLIDKVKRNRENRSLMGRSTVRKESTRWVDNLLLGIEKRYGKKGLQLLKKSLEKK